MRKRRLLWQLFPTYLLITLLALAATTWYASLIARDLYHNQFEEDLRARAFLVRQAVAEPLLDREGRATLQPLVERLGTEAGMRITLVGDDGRVLADSAGAEHAGETFGDRSEVRKALRGEPGMSLREDETHGMPVMFVAVPVPAADHSIAAAVRASLPASAIRSALDEIYTRVALGGVLVLLVAGAVSYYASMRISTPLEELKRGAERFASGQLNRRIASMGSEEIDALAESMNGMAGELDARIRLITRQNNEMDAVFNSMLEGILAVDAEERIIHINPAACRLLEVSAGEVQGRYLHESVRNPDLQRIVAETLLRPDPVHEEILLHGESTERSAEVHGTPLLEGDGRRIGALVILNEVTHLRRLESIRRDFAANVSHELRTPITAIKGFVETLLDGELAEPGEIRHFLGIVQRQAVRLKAIIEDLLSLSRIEREAEGDIEDMELRTVPVRRILETAAEACSGEAGRRGIDLRIDCPSQLTARVNKQLVEQAMINLVTNAIRYSESGTVTRIGGGAGNGGVELYVTDQGCGIEPEHLPRLFERFYRIDKARSRNMGGTGLGLAIVKHIARAHGGAIEVDSTPGEGSTFTLRLPA